jgi:hypothetical protein
MKEYLSANINWFLENLKDFSFFREISVKDIFKYSAEDLIEKYQGSKNLVSLLLAEKFLQENMENGFFSYKLLVPVLEKRNIKGCLFYFPNKNFWEKKGKLISKYGFIKIDENLYFYPSEWGNSLKILIFLWKNRIKFNSIEVSLNKKISIESLKSYIKLAQILDFSYLSQRALDVLKDYLPTLETEELLDVREKFLKTKESILILASGNGIKDILRKEKAKIIKTIDGEKTLFLVKNLDFKKLILLYENRSGKIKAGVLSKEVWRKFGKKGLSPLMFLIGALEHAKRVNDTKVKLFEGFTYHVIGDLYYEWKDFGKALKYYLIAKDYTLQPVELILSESAIYYVFGEIDKAEKILREGLCGCQKEDPLIHYNLALIYLKKEENKKAKYHLYKAHLLEPENQIFREALAKFLWDSGEYEELEEFLDSLKSLSAKEKIFLGKLYFYKKEYKKAFKYLRGILFSKDRDGETLLFLAWLYLYFNKEKEVSEILLKEAREILSPEEFERIKKDFGLEI